MATMEPTEAQIAAALEAYWTTWEELLHAHGFPSSRAKEIRDNPNIVAASQKCMRAALLAAAKIQ